MTRAVLLATLAVTIVAALVLSTIPPARAQQAPCNPAVQTCT
jgi:hypothetical protein